MDLFVLLFGVFFFLLQIRLGQSQISVTYENSTLGPFDCEEGEFGRTSYWGTFKGMIYVANPKNGCLEMTPSDVPEGFGGSYSFVLINDGECSYYTKLLHALNSGYSAAIVRSLTSNSLTTMKGSSVNILGVYVGKSTGEILQKYNYTTRAMASIHVEPNFNFEMYLIPLLIIIGICFVLLLLFLGVKYWRTRLHERRNRLTPANLKKIPTKKFKEGDDYDLCAICLDDYKLGEKLRLLPCKHAYHCKCVDPWLTNGKKTCPVCKQPVEDEETKEPGPLTRVLVDETTPLLREDRRESAPSASPQTNGDSSSGEIV